MRQSRYNIWIKDSNCHFVFNTLSGSLLCVHEEEYEKLLLFLNGEDINECSSDLLTKLAQGHMIIRNDFDELALLSKRFDLNRNNKSHFSLTIVNSLGCNFNCIYCFEKKYSSIMSEDVQNHVIKLLEQKIVNINSFNVSWYGGEPLLGKKVLIKLSETFIEKCKQAKVKYSAKIVTNGYLLNKVTCTQLRDCQVKQAQITIDGPPEIHNKMRPLVNGEGSFWQIIKNLHNAVQYMDVLVRVNIAADNTEYTEQLFDILKKEGFINKISIYPGRLQNFTANKDTFSGLYQPSCLNNNEFSDFVKKFQIIAKKYGFFGKPNLPKPIYSSCTASRSNEWVIGSKGELYKCWVSVGDTNEVVGNIRDINNLNSCLKKWISYNPLNDDECRRCIVLPLCMGGCYDLAFNKSEYKNRCLAFRYNYHDTILNFIRAQNLN
jgi:uncharacterized protein